LAEKPAEEREKRLEGIHYRLDEAPYALKDLAEQAVFDLEVLLVGFASCRFVCCGLLKGGLPVGVSVVSSPAPCPTRTL
jgi:hypothetical protein